MIAELTLEEIKTGLRGELIEPGDQGYDEARKVYNGMIDRHPRLIARCADVADVIAAVKAAADNVTYWERRVTDAKAELLKLRVNFGEGHHECKAQREAISLYEEQLWKARLRAAELEVSSAAARTRFAVLALTMERVAGLSAREAVDTWTPAARATSRSVTEPSAMSSFTTFLPLSACAGIADWQPSYAFDCSFLLR